MRISVLAASCDKAMLNVITGDYLIFKPAVGLPD